MMGLGNLVKRNCKLFFKDKGMFFTSLITPIILLVLYGTFLAKVYRESFTEGMPQEMLAQVGDLVDGTVGGQLLSSLLAVCCVTVSFCCNMLMVQDRVTGARKDLTMTPVSKSTLALGYYISTVISTLIICLVTTGAGLLYIKSVGWYLSGGDVVRILGVVVLLVLLGTAISSSINVFLSTQGQISAVGSVVSAGYGFICGAYMPISQFGEGLQKVLSFMPWTYGTSLLRNYCMAGAFREMENKHFPKEVIEGIKQSVDCNIKFMGEQVELNSMWLVLSAGVVGFVIIYVVLHMLRKEK